MTRRIHTQGNSRPHRIATRNGEAAWVNAPPRLRASQIERPTVPQDERKGIARWFR